MLKSAPEIVEWMNEIEKSIRVKISKINFEKLQDWHFEPSSGDIIHESGKFFQVKGIHVKTNWGKINSWSQPIIKQSEIGILGILMRYIDEEPYFLLQAKIEPGNINLVQLSPTLQATKSNYTSVHGGKKVPYLKYFVDLKNDEIISDQLHSEQGSRFLRKRNRNIIIHITDRVPVLENFMWIPLKIIQKLFHYDNILNMDTRSVLSSFLFHKNLDNHSKSIPLYNIDQIISWITSQKVYYNLEVTEIGLKEVKDWKISSSEIAHIHNKYFSIFPIEVKIEGREVEYWTQPIIKPNQSGICAFIAKKINDSWHFLVQAKVECGNIDIIELAPTLQCLNDNYKDSENELPYLDYILNANSDEIHFDSMLSEEGGRFYNEENRNLILKVGKDFPTTCPKNYIWMTLEQIQLFAKFNNYFNIQARSLISAIIGKEHEYS